jgi:hypothetical protein
MSIMDISPDLYFKPRGRAPTEDQAEQKSSHSFSSDPSADLERIQ